MSDRTVTSAIDLPGLASELAARFRDSPVVVAFLAGSLVEGLGNARSDVDLYVVEDGAEGRRRLADWLQEAAFLDDDGTRIDVGWIRETVRVDVETWQPARAADVAGRLRAFEQGDLAVVDFSDLELEFAHSVLSGIALEGFDDPFAELQETFHAPTLSRAVRDRCLLLFHAFFEDGAGGVEVRDHRLALYASREALGQATHALACARGATSPKRKWRLHLLERTGAAFEAEEVLRAEIDTSADPEGILVGSRLRLRVASKLAHRAQQEQPA